MDKLIEAAEFSGDRKNIIKTDEGYILKNVVLLSEYSKNPGPSGKPRRYTKETQEEACPHFNNLQICVNHPAGGASRDALSVIGKSVNPKVVAIQEGTKKVHKTIGDVHLINCAASDHLVKVGQLDPRLLGMSITGDGKFKENVEGYDNVDKLKPNTSDFVHRPATTKGLFESIQEDVNLSTEVKTEILGKLSERADEIQESFEASGADLPTGVVIPEKAQRPAGRIQEGEEKIGDSNNRAGQLSSQLRGLKATKKTKVAVTESEDVEDELDEDENEENEEKKEFKKIVESEKTKVKEDDDSEAEDEDEGDADDLPEDVDDDSEEDGDEDVTGDNEDEDDNEDDSEYDPDEDEKGQDNPGDQNADNDRMPSDGEGDGQNVNTNPNGMSPEDAAKAITDTANAATFEANTANSPESHMDACFAHCGACAQLAGVDKDAARAHFMKANEHNEVANNLKDKEAPEMLTPAPETTQESEEIESDETEVSVTEQEILEEVMEEDFKTMGIEMTPVLASAYKKLSEEERPEFLKAVLPKNESGSRGKVNPKSIKVAEAARPEGKHSEKIKELFVHTNPISEEDKAEAPKKVRTWSEVLSK